MISTIALNLLLLQGITLDEGPKPNAAGMAAEYSDGVCRISLFSKDNDGEQIRAEFSRRLRDGNFGISLYGPFIQKFQDQNRDAVHAVTVNFDNASSAASRSGGYDIGGFRQNIWGGWGPGAASDATYEQLSKATSFTVNMDGSRFGPFSANSKGAIYDALDDCESKNN